MADQKKSPTDQQPDDASRVDGREAAPAEELNFDDDEVMSRGNARSGGTWDAQGADSGKIAPPREIMSDRNGPSDPEPAGDKKRKA